MKKLIFLFILILFALPAIAEEDSEWDWLVKKQESSAFGSEIAMILDYERIMESKRITQGLESATLDDALTAVANAVATSPHIPIVGIGSGSGRDIEQGSGMKPLPGSGGKLPPGRGGGISLNPPAGGTLIRR